MSDENEPQNVPKSRLDKAISDRNEARAELADLRKQLEELKPLADSVSEVTAALEAERKARADDAARFKARESFVRLGLEDEDAMEIIRQRWDALPKKGRPSLEDFAKEDKIASALLPKPEPEAGAQPEGEPAGEPQAAAPKATASNAGTEEVPPAAPELTRAEYNRQIDDALRRGDKDRAREIQRQYMGG